MHATEFLRAVPREMPLVIAMAGEERALKLMSLEAILKMVLPEDDQQPSRFSGPDATMTDVRDELQTVSMFGGRRVVVVDEAGDFVTNHRAALEKYADAPSKRSILILDVKSLPKNTKLFGIISSKGLVLECTELKGVALTRWIQDTLKREHNKSLTRTGADLLIELVGNSIGLLEQELRKLAAYAGDETTINDEMVRKLVGGWRADTTWEMIDAIRAGNAGEALHMLDKLLSGGEHALRILGGLVYDFRKMSIATELSRQNRQLGAALQEAGVWGNKIAPAEHYLKRIGRPKAEQITAWLMQAECAIKGGSAASDRSVMERLLLQLCGVL